MTGLDEFLPSSYGAQQAFARQMETLLAEYGREEDQRLAAQMPPREISLCNLILTATGKKSGAASGNAKPAKQQAMALVALPAVPYEIVGP